MDLEKRNATERCDRDTHDDVVEKRQEIVIARYDGIDRAAALVDDLAALVVGE